MNKYVGWLSPEGLLVSCDGYAHLDMASKLVKKYNLTDDKYHADDILYENGWVRISQITYGDVGLMFFLPRRITIKQREFLKQVDADRQNYLISEKGKEVLESLLLWR